MRFRTGVLVMAGAAALLPGCASLDPRARAPISHQATGLTDGGCVNMMLGAIKRGPNRSGFIHHGLWYRAVGSTEEGSFYQSQSGLSDTSKDIDDETTRATAMRVCLKPGDYEIFQFSLYWNNGSAEKSVRAEKEMKVPFSVGLGQELYLGRVLANGVWGKNVFGMALPVGAVFVVEDAMNQDSPLIKARHPGMSEMTPAVLVIGPEAAPYMVRK